MAHVCSGNSGNHLSLDQGASLDLMSADGCFRSFFNGVCYFGVNDISL